VAEPFVLTVVPKLLPDGSFQGHLESVEFKADNGETSYLWWSPNIGIYVDEFAKIMPRAEAYAIVASSPRRNGHRSRLLDAE
jgi:hypothetical protein